MAEIKEITKEVAVYCREVLVPKVIKSVKIAFHAFIETLWECLKDEVMDSARKSLELIKTIWTSTEVKEKKNAIIEVIMLRIKLPLIAKPFKGVIKRIISNKVDDIVEALLGKGFELLG